MLRFLKETWLPTAVFIGTSWWVATADAGMFHYAILVTTLIVVPLAWKSFVIREGRPRLGRAMLAGSAATLVNLWSEAVPGALRELARPTGGSEGLAGLLVILVLIIEFIDPLLGGAIALLTALVQARFSPDSTEGPETGHATLDGAVGGALVATLVTPVAAIPFASLMPNQTTPIMNLLTVTVGTWLILVFGGSLLGVRATRRWKRILAESTERS